MTTLTVTGMTCEHCEKSVEKALAGLPGVDRVVKVSRAEQEIVVEGDAEVEAIISAIEEEGYEASVR